MLIRKNAYFDQFRCLADRCPDSCCKEWDVQVDAASVRFYRALRGPLGDRLRQVLSEDPEAGTVMTIENGRCPMWRQDGLCRIQAELGHDALCKTCRDFPRLTHDYGDFVELGLELSCPEAARLLLTQPAAAPVVTETPGGEAPEYAPEDMSLLLKTREEALSIVSDPAYAPQDALILLLFYGYQAQELLDGGEAPDFAPEIIFSQAQSLARPGGTKPLLCFFSELEILTPQWKLRLGEPAKAAPWSELFRNLARYGIERYWLQAISDYELAARVKLIIVSCLVVKLLGGDPVATAQTYSKEIENDADNIDSILDGVYAHPALTDASLLGLLLEE